MPMRVEYAGVNLPPAKRRRQFYAGAEHPDIAGFQVEFWSPTQRPSVIIMIELI